MSTITISTWNVNSIKVRLSQIIEWLDINKPDILALQETKAQNKDFPKEVFESIGYNVVFSGQKSYNGVATISKIIPENIITSIPNFEDQSARVLASSYGDYRIINIYAPNGSEVGSEKYFYKLNWYQALTTWLTEELKQHKNVIVLGDFNIAPVDQDVYDPIAWKDSVLVSKPERDAFFKLIDIGFADSFRLFNQSEKSYTWWDYRMNAFKRNLGIRLDHILISNALKPLCNSCFIDKSPRKHEQPSDHTPVVIILQEVSFLTS